jgi:hypothetical protein
MTDPVSLEAGGIPFLPLNAPHKLSLFQLSGTDPTRLSIRPDLLHVHTSTPFMYIKVIKLDSK